MAKISARGCYELARVEGEWKAYDEKLKDFSKVTFILRSDGAILRKMTFKSTSASMPPYYTGSTSIAAKFKATTPKENWEATFKSYAQRRIG